MLAAPAWAGFDEGVAAYNRRDYATAFREFRPLAEQGYADAQSRLGVMYGIGEGVAQNSTEAARWYLKAAEQGQAAYHPPGRGKGKMGVYRAEETCYGEIQVLGTRDGDRGSESLWTSLDR